MSIDQYQYPTATTTYTSANPDGIRSESSMTYVQTPTALERQQQLTVAERPGAIVERPMYNPERPNAEMLKNMELMNQFDRVMFMRSQADYDTLRLNRITRLFRPIMEGLFGRPQDRNASLLEELMNLESEVGGRLLDESGATQRFWFGDGLDGRTLIYYGSLTKNRKWSYAQYEVTKSNVYKTFNGDPVSMTVPEKSRLYELAPQYISAINEEIYLNDKVAVVLEAERITRDAARIDMQESIPEQTQASVSPEHDQVALSPAEQAAIAELERVYAQQSETASDDHLVGAGSR